MLNNVFLLGKIKKMPVPEREDCIFLEVKRNYKNTIGVFESDVFKCDLWVAISKKIVNSCKEGDLIAVKGRLMEKEGICHILAEQLVLLNKSC